MGFTPVANQLRIQLPDPIGVDQLKRKNAFAEQDQQIQQGNALAYQGQADMNRQNMLRNWGAQDKATALADQTRVAQEVHTLAQYAVQAKTPEEFRSITAKLAQNPLVAKHLAEKGATAEQITPQDVQELLAESGSQIGAGPAKQFETVQGPRGSVIQRDPITGEMKQVVGADNSQPAPVTPSYDFIVGADGNVLAGDKRTGGMRPTGQKGQVSAANRPAGDKPLPVGAIRLQQDSRDALSAAAGIDQSLNAIKEDLKSGKLALGAGTNLVSRARNAMGVSDDQSTAYATAKSSLEKLRNDSLRLNKGVQTEGDSQRAWDELIGNLNDPKVVTAQIDRILSINQRARQLQQDNIAAIDENYGREPSALPQSAQPQQPQIQEGATATGPNGQRIQFRNGKWGPLSGR